MEKRTKKQKAALALGGFFILMALCGAVSRAAASLTVPQVTTQSCREGKLEISFGGQGVTEFKEEKLISLVSGLRISQCAQEGDRVEKGELLAQYDMAYLQEKLEEKKGEVKKLELSKEQARLSGLPQARVSAEEGAGRELSQAQEALAQAEETYQNTLTQAEEKKAQAQGELEAAKESAEQERSKTREQARQLREEGREEEAKALEEEAERNYEEAKSGAQAQYDSIAQELEAQISQAQSEAQARSEAKASAENAYAAALEEDAAASANDQRTQEESGYDQQSIQVDLDQASKEVKTLEELAAKEGKLLAEEAGQVKATSLAPGGITDDSSSILLGYGGCQIRGEVSGEDFSKLREGDKVSISIPGRGKEKEAKIRELKLGEASGEQTQEGEKSQGGGVFLADVDLDIGAGRGVSYSFSKQTDTAYEQKLALGAIREDQEGTYCLVAEPEETVLGTEYVAKRVSLTVLEQDKTSAAVESNLGTKELVITGSDKEIQEGDRVRLEE